MQSHSLLQLFLVFFLYPLIHSYLPLKRIFKKTIVTVSVDLYIKITILKKLFSKAVNEKGEKIKNKKANGHGKRTQ